jgi:hypothetical protein
LVTQKPGNGLDRLIFVGEIARSTASPTKINDFTTLPIVKGDSKAVGIYLEFPIPDKSG